MELQAGTGAVHLVTAVNSSSRSSQHRQHRRMRALQGSMQQAPSSSSSSSSEEELGARVAHAGDALGTPGRRMAAAGGKHAGRR